MQPEKYSLFMNYLLFEIMYLLIDVCHLLTD